MWIYPTYFRVLTKLANTEPPHVRKKVHLKLILTLVIVEVRLRQKGKTESRDTQGLSACMCLLFLVVVQNAKLKTVSQTATLNAREGKGGWGVRTLSLVSLYSLSFCRFPEPAGTHFSPATNSWWPPSHANREAWTNGCETHTTDLWVKKEWRTKSNFFLLIWTIFMLYTFRLNYFCMIGEKKIFQIIASLLKTIYKCTY